MGCELLVLLLYELNFRALLGVRVRVGVGVGASWGGGGAPGNDEIMVIPISFFYHHYKDGRTVLTSSGSM